MPSTSSITSWGPLVVTVTLFPRCLCCHCAACVISIPKGPEKALLSQVTDDAGVYAVIAPNMCKQIVAFQATMQSMAEKFPGAFDG